MPRVTTDQLVKTLRRRLPDHVFRPNGARIGWFFLHIGAFALASTLGLKWGVVDGEINWPLLLALGTLVGFNFAGLAFVAHETLHGAVTKNRRLKLLIGQIGFAPFCVSPHLWMAWHNRVHHPNTNVEGIDPDAYPSLNEYKTNRAARLAVQLAAPRCGKWRGTITLLLGFSIQSAQILLGAKRRNHLSPRHYRRALVETAFSATFWCAWAIILGPALFCFLYVLPLMIANTIVMSYILTNHSLSPLVHHDDTLTSTLSVTVPAWYETFSLQFGYHVEHHLFPTMSHVHGPLVREAICELCPERYQSLPLGKALAFIFTTPRVYKNDTILFDPETGAEASTLSERDLAPTKNGPQLQDVDSLEDLALERSRIRTKLKSTDKPEDETLLG